MKNITECTNCGCKEFKTNKYGDIHCSKCSELLQREYDNHTVHYLQKNMTNEDIEAEITSCIYNAGCIIEALEAMGYYKGNGHHAAQRIAEYAKKVFRGEG